MRRSGRWLAVLAVSVALGLGAWAPTEGVHAADLPPGGSFEDDDGSIHEGAIEAIAAEGITRGCNPPINTRFCPNASVTRGQMAAFLARALALTPETRTFGDVPPGHVFHADIGRLAAEGITRGCNPPANTRFCPDRPVTRGEMAAFLARARTLPAGEGVFSDVPPGHVFHADIGRLAAEGITRGCNPPTNTRFCPDRPVTRAEMATFLQRALDLTPRTPPPRDLPVAGNPSGMATVPTAARSVDTSDPDTVVGTGTPASCTSGAVVDAVAKGGVIVFDCGPDPVTIAMHATAKVRNDRPDVVLDGGGLVTLSGQGSRRILYMNTCDPAQVWTTPHCQDQDHPTLVVQGLTFRDGRASGSGTQDGGGAIFVRGGRFRVVDSRFFGNRCADTGPDVAGAAIQVFSQYQGRPVFVVNSTFGGVGDALANTCSNGGGVASIGVSWTILNSVFTHNHAVGVGANPARPGTPGGGNGGAVYNDGNRMTLRVEGTRIVDNEAREGGGAVFFVSNDRSGDVVVRDSVLTDNRSQGFETAGWPGIFFLGRSIVATGSSITP